jgi:hypothetical protein
VADPKPEETFKVIDRRLFTDTGEFRKDVAEQQQRDEEAAVLKASTAQKATAAAPGSKRPRQQDAGEILHDAQGDSAGSAETHGPAPESSRGFQMLVDFLTRNAAATLGGMADPRTGQAFLDLEGAREMIEMLDALREKTRGNLSKADDDLLIEVLGSLKLTFMEVSKAASEVMAKKASKKG